MTGRSVVVAHVTNVSPGQLTVTDVEGTRIAVANVDGRFYAFDDTCTHKGCALADGDLAGTTVTCPCHGAQFDVTNGRVVAPPAKTGVRSYPVHVQDGQLAIEL